MLYIVWLRSVLIQTVTIGGEVFETVEGEGRYVYVGLGRLLLPCCILYD